MNITRRNFLKGATSAVTYAIICAPIPRLVDPPTSDTATLDPYPTWNVPSGDADELLKRMQNGEVIINESFILSKTITVPNTKWRMINCTIRVNNNCHIEFPYGCSEPFMAFCCIWGET